MNNGKYFREMDFGRFDWYFRTGLSDYLEARPGTNYVSYLLFLVIIFKLIGGYYIFEHIEIYFIYQ